MHHLVIVFTNLHEHVTELIHFIRFSQHRFWTETEQI